MRAKALFVVELIVIAAVFYLDYRGWLLFSKTPYLFLLGWISLRVRNLSWRDVGLNGEQPFLKILVIGVVAGIAMEATELFDIDRLTERNILA